MVNPSSTSNSDGKARRALLVWLLAIGIVLGIDRLSLGDTGVWDTLLTRIDRSHRFEYGLVRDRLELRRLRDASPGQSRVAVVGSSRAAAGFWPHLIDKPVPDDLIFSTIAHGGFTTFEIRSMIDDLLESDPQVVVLVLSELELNTPLQILTQSSFTSLSAIQNLLSATGWRFALLNRHVFYRLIAANLLNSYRYRQVLDRALTHKLRRFPTQTGSATERALPTPRLIISEGRPRPLDQPHDELAQVMAQFPETPAAIVEASFKKVRRITRGIHCAIQQDFVGNSIERLTAAGVRVVLIEAPLHPSASRFFDAAIRQDFLAYASDLVQRFPIRFVPLEAIGPFRSEDFTDLIHLGREGSRRLTWTIILSVQETLERSPPRATK